MTIYIYSRSIDFKLGYAFVINKLAVYGIGSGIYQSVGGLEGAELVMEQVLIIDWQII